MMRFATDTVTNAPASACKPRCGITISGSWTRSVEVDRRKAVVEGVEARRWH